MKISIRTEFSKIEPTYTILEHIKDIELAFHFRAEFFSVDINALLRNIRQMDLHVNSIHAPALQLEKAEEFIRGLKRCAKMCTKLECNVLVIHPSKVNDREDAIKFIKRGITPILKKYDLILAWENFPGHKRIANSVNELVQLITEINEPEHHSICLDTSHTKAATEDLMRIMTEYKNYFRAYHISNWNAKQQHLPLFHSDGKINFNKILKPKFFNKDATVTLEYMEEFRIHLNEDYQAVKKALLQTQ